MTTNDIKNKHHRHRKLEERIRHLEEEKIRIDDQIEIMQSEINRILEGK